MNPYKFDSGAVFEVPLFENYGFAYIKIIHFKESGNALIKTFDKYSNHRFDGTIESFHHIDYSVLQYLLLGEIKIKGKDSWKYIGTLPLKVTDLEIPELKRSIKYLDSPHEDPTTFEWRVIRNFDPSDHYYADFKTLDI